MNILSIHDGHYCGATLVQNGIVKSSVCEERISRKKNEVGYPKYSIEDVMRLSNVKSDEIDVVVFASLFPEIIRTVSALILVTEIKYINNNNKSFFIFF